MGLSFLDNGRKLIPVRNFCSTALFTEWIKIPRIMPLPTKSKIADMINSILCFGLVLIDFVYLFGFFV